MYSDSSVFRGGIFLPHCSAVWGQVWSKWVVGFGHGGCFEKGPREVQEFVGGALE